MKKLSIVFILLLSATSANAAIMWGLVKTPSLPTNNITNLLFIKPTISPPPAPKPAIIVAPVVTKVATPIPEQHFAFLTEETKRQINEIVNCVDEPKDGGHDNVSAVPVPAALPLMATAFGIFGITRRRKAFK